MTSELKPCPFCGAEVPCLDEECPLNTRAVPDVPELVRYERTVADERQEHFGMVEHRYGEYVLHSQAAEIIAADRAEKHRAQEAVLKLERELAQYKDQIPIGYITPKAQLSLLQEFSASDSISPVKMGECRVAIYDRPAPAADLKAENERLRVRLNAVADDFDLIQQRINDGQIERAKATAWQGEREARAALNVEASNES